jgi:hypothetical protein
MSGNKTSRFEVVQLFYVHVFHEFNMMMMGRMLKKVDKERGRGEHNGIIEFNSNSKSSIRD